MSLSGLGAYQSPQILELSGALKIFPVSFEAILTRGGTGIGSKEILNGFNIKTLVDLPGVGENLREPHANFRSFIR